MVDHAFAGIFHRHNAEVRTAGFDQAKDLLDARNRLGFDQAAKMLDRRGVGIGALRPQERNLEGLFECEANRHDFAENARNRIVRERPLVALLDLAQHLRFAFGPVEMFRIALLSLNFGNPARALGSLRHQVLNRRIDLVDALPDISERVIVCHRGRPCC